jgi:ApaG protein
MLRMPRQQKRNAMASYEFTVTVNAQYLAEQSDPDRSHYVFAYTVTIRNTGQVAAQLISRHWIIADANDDVQEVSGLGVVGNQPLLHPGEQFEYTSGAALKTPQGSMKGEYFCVAEDGKRFEVPIPEFVLSQPRTLH